MKNLRVAIIGQGRSGRDIHGAYFLSNANAGRFSVVAIAEKLAERRTRAETEHKGAAVVSDYTAFFRRDDIDLVVNASTSEQHVPITLDLLENGFHVICEKPLAQTAAEADKLIEAAEKHGRMLNVFQQSRFAPYFLKVKEIIASGVLGRLVEINIQFNGFARRWDWQTLQSRCAGGLLNTGPHPLDQALNLLDMADKMPQVFCKMDRVNTYGDANDYCKLILTAPNKPLVDLSVSSCDAYPLYTYKIQGQYGGLQGTQTEIFWKYFNPAEAPAQKLILEPISNPDGTPAYCKESLIWHENKWNAADSGAFTSAVDSYYTMIYDYFTAGKPMEISPSQVRQQIAVIEECDRQNPLSKLGL